MSHVLIVEDEEAFREFMRLALSLEGYQVRAVGNGAAALEALQDGAPPDLVVLDLSMPQISGWDVLRFIRQTPALKDVPVLVVTANADEATRRRSLQEQVDMLVKPVSVDEILTAAQKLVAS